MVVRVIVVPVEVAVVVFVVVFAVVLDVVVVALDPRAHADPCMAIQPVFACRGLYRPLAPLCTRHPRQDTRAHPRGRVCAFSSAGAI